MKDLPQELRDKLAMNGLVAHGFDENYLVISRVGQTKKIQILYRLFKNEPEPVIDSANMLLDMEHSRSY